MKKLTLVLCLLMSLLLISCGEKKPKETEFVTLEMTLVTNEKITETYNLEVGTKFYIEEHYGSYWITGYTDNTYYGHLRNGVINYKVISRTK